MSLSTQSLIEALNVRYATKKFDPAFRLSAEQSAAIAESLRLTPSSFGLQPWKFVKVSNAALRADLQPVSWNQPQITEASELYVLCRQDKYDKEDVARYVRSVAEARGQTVESLSTYQQMMEGHVANLAGPALNVWMEKQVYIALGNLLTSVALLGLDACPIEGFDRDSYDRILGLPERNLRALVICAIGKHAEDDKYAKAPKVRYPQSDVILEI